MLQNPTGGRPIGQRMAQIGLALGMEVLASDPHKTIADPGVGQVAMAELLERSDFVVCLVVATEETENLMNASAFAAMKGSGARGVGHAETLVPTIVFHGDRDHTVSAANGEAIIAQVGGADVALDKGAQTTGTAGGGRSFTRTDYRAASGLTVVEDWRVHGGGHAWMGGSAAGTYTDPQGPDASAEMLRFFLQHARA